jgi:hypothetical protein
MTKPSGEIHRGLTGRLLGAAKSAAKKTGLTLDEWIERRNDGTKRCFRCKQWKQVEFFSSDTSRATGKSSSCKQCSSNASKRSIYGLSKERLDLMLSSPCEICGRSDRRIDIDHCHKTGRVRGSLCETCNRGIGLLGDTHEMLEKAFLYLKKDY